MQRLFEDQEHKFQLLEIGLKHPNTKNTLIASTIIELILKMIAFFMHMGLVLISPERILIQDAIEEIKTENN